jgi:hypothetical protein
MSLSMHDASAPCFARMLRKLDAILAKAQAHAAAKKIDPAVLLGFALPTFHFHLVTACNILRHNGIEIGKADYLGSP